VAPCHGLCCYYWKFVCVFEKAFPLPSVLRFETEREKELCQQLKQENDTAARLQGELRQAEDRERQLQMELDEMKDNDSQPVNKKKRFDNSK